MKNDRSHSLRDLAWVFGLGALLIGTASASESSQVYRRYFVDTYASLECLRGDNGLIRDKVVIERGKGTPACPIARTYDATSPTNIGFDLLSQIAAYRLGYSPKRSLRTIDRVLSILTRLSYERASGMFYNRYSASGEARPLPSEVSSVDNLHLALAFWTIAHEFPGTSRAARANALFVRMKFSAFYDRKTGLFAGELTRHWYYSYFGSEARSIYALGWGLGLIDDPHFLEKAFSHLKSEVLCPNDREFGGPLLRLWDGGTFQLLLPQTLIGESMYSPLLATLFRNYGVSVLSEGPRRGLPVPATFSASEAGVEGVTCGPNLPCYNGKAGSPKLIASENADFGDRRLREQWDAVFTPHAAILAAQTAPARFAESLVRAEHLSSNGNFLYEPGLGWMDAYRVKNPGQNTVVPALLAVDQEMSALAIANILAPDRLSSTARALNADPGVRARLTEFYRHVSSGFLPNCERPTHGY